MNEQQIHDLAERNKKSKLLTQTERGIIAASDLVKQLNDDQREANEIIKRIRKENYRLRQELDKPDVPDGWKLVPVEPTEAMYAAFWSVYDSDPNMSITKSWKAMLNAAPQPESDE